MDKTPMLPSIKLLEIGNGLNKATVWLDNDNIKHSTCFMCNSKNQTTERCNFHQKNLEREKMKAKIYISVFDLPKVYCPGCDFLMSRNLENQFACEVHDCKFNGRLFEFEPPEIELKEIEK